MQERLKWPGLAVVLGILGAAARRWQLNTAFVGINGFLVKGAPATAAVLACLVLAAVLGVLLANATRDRTSKEGRKSRWDLTFAGEGCTPYMTLMVVSAFATVAACPLLFLDAMEKMAAFKTSGSGDNGILLAIVAVGALPAGWALLSTGRDAYNMKGMGRENALLLIPPAVSCVWVLEAYRSNAADPVLWNYVPLVLAAMCGLLFYVECAALSFEKGHPRRALFWGLMTVVVSAVAIAALPERGVLALLAGQMAAALGALWVAPANLNHPPEISRFGLRARQGEPKEDETDEPEDTLHAQEIQEEDHHV